MLIQDLGTATHKKTNINAIQLHFKNGIWNQEINIKDFIKQNVEPYYGDESFLQPPTQNTIELWKTVSELMKIERQKGILDADTKIVSSITSHAPGYINKNLEKIVGLQTDAPLKRAIIAFGGIRLAKQALESYGYKLDPETEKVFKLFRKTHNDGVFDAYTDEMLKARRSAIITGLPDAYGRGRIIGDYRRVALYGVDQLIKEKKQEWQSLDDSLLNESMIQLREEISEQIKSLSELKEMALSYGFDISHPATNGQEATQWLYFAYLASAKEQNGAAMSLGRVSTFLDIYFENDLKKGLFNESQVQEIVDHFVMKLRMIRFLRVPEYNDLFSGDPTWVTEAIGGVCEDGRPLITKTSFRFLHTLYNLGPAPEPNLTVIWSEKLPSAFKKFVAKVSCDTSSIQYENDDLMRPVFGDDYAIACCVSAMKLGEQMQFFGARANLAKALLYAINGGKDEISGEQVGPVFHPISSEYLDYDEVMSKYDQVLDWLSALYIKTLNVIHYMHDKYCYERLEMALHDKEVVRWLACGFAGLSVVADSLSAIKFAKVKVVRDASGLAVDFIHEGDFPKFGNNDDRVDSIAIDIVKVFMQKLRAQKTYRESIPTLSILTITSNVVYGKKTGSTPDGRKRGEPLAPGANPMHGRDTKGAVASMASVAKLPYAEARDGISYTFSIVPQALGKTEEQRTQNLVGLLEAYFHDGAHHINVNVLERETLIHAMEHPELYPQLTIRVSGYAVNFIKLTREQQLEVIHRTFHFNR